MPHFFEAPPEDYSLAARGGFEATSTGLVTGVGFRLDRRLDRLWQMVELHQAKVSQLTRAFKMLLDYKEGI